MTLTAVQAEIVRRFVAGETIGAVAWESVIPEWERTRQLEDTDRESEAHAIIEYALRAALIEKDAEIERLRGYLDTPKGTSP